MINWLEDMSAEKLTKLELILKRARAIKGLISQKEKEIKSFFDLLRLHNPSESYVNNYI